jgi:hypothetical protein
VPQEGELRDLPEAGVRCEDLQDLEDLPDPEDPPEPEPKEEANSVKRMEHAQNNEVARGRESEIWLRMDAPEDRLPWMEAARKKGDGGGKGDPQDRASRPRRASRPNPQEVLPVSRMGPKNTLLFFSNVLVPARNEFKYSPEKC